VISLIGEDSVPVVVAYLVLFGFWNKVFKLIEFENAACMILKMVHYFALQRTLSIFGEAK
jgi:hypothetical protein